MTAYLYSAPAGVPGDVSRPDETNVEPAKLIAVSSVFAQAFGIPVKYATGGISQIASGDAATVFAGILIREAPSIAGSNTQGLDDAIPNQFQVQGFAVRGYVTVKCVAGTPVRGGIVYMQVTANSPYNVGDLRADGVDSGNAVALTATQASWASDGKDASNNAEIRIAR